MTPTLRRCPVDGRYTLEATCPDHPDVRTVRPDPAKYSPEDPHGTYRRRLKRLEGWMGLPPEGA